MGRPFITLHTRGRITLPVEIRALLGLTEAAQLKVDLEQDQITLRLAQTPKRRRTPRRPRS